MLEALLPPVGGNPIFYVNVFRSFFVGSTLWLLTFYGGFSSLPKLVYGGPLLLRLTMPIPLPFSMKMVLRLVFLLDRPLDW